MKKPPGLQSEFVYGSETTTVMRKDWFLSINVGLTYKRKDSSLKFSAAEERLNYF